jgi:hypothetical protein
MNLSESESESIPMPSLPLAEPAFMEPKPLTEKEWAKQQKKAEKEAEKLRLKAAKKAEKEAEKLRLKAAKKAEKKTSHVPNPDAIPSPAIPAVIPVPAYGEPTRSESEFEFESDSEPDENPYTSIIPIQKPASPHVPAMAMAPAVAMAPVTDAVAAAVAAIAAVASPTPPLTPMDVDVDVDVEPVAPVHVEPTDNVEPTDTVVAGKPRTNKPRKYTVRFSSGMGISDTIQYILTYRPIEQPKIMNGLTIKTIHSKSSARELSFLSILTAQELSELMAESNHRILMETFQPQNIVEHVTQKRKRTEGEGEPTPNKRQKQ